MEILSLEWVSSKFTVLLYNNGVGWRISEVRLLVVQNIHSISMLFPVKAIMQDAKKCSISMPVTFTQRHYEFPRKHLPTPRQSTAE